MALVTDIADAVANELNGETFTPPFSAERKVLPNYELSELEELKVSVVPKAVEIAGASRNMGSYEVLVDVGIQKKLGKDLDAELPPLLDLVDQIIQFLTRRPLQDAPHAVWSGIVNEPVYAPEHLAEKRTFTSVVTVTYRAMK